MLVYVALDEQDAPRRVKPSRQQKGGDGDSCLRKLFGVPRDSQGVQIDYAVQGVVPVLEVDPPAQGPEVVAQVRGTGRLYTRENPFGGLCCCHDNAGYMALGPLDGHYPRGWRDAWSWPRRPDGHPFVCPPRPSRFLASARACWWVRRCLALVGTRRGFRGPRPATGGGGGGGGGERTAIGVGTSTVRCVGGGMTTLLVPGGGCSFGPFGGGSISGPT